MGQYYDLLNLDKKEMLVLSDCSCFKLWDYGCSSKYQNAVINLLASKWCGDSIVLLGDYTDDVAKGSADQDRIAFIRNKLNYSGCMQDITDNFKEIEYDAEDNGFRYLYNHELKQFLHLKDSYSDFYPILLLLTVGNGLGMGDYQGTNENLVGSWASTSHSIEVCKSPLPITNYVSIPDEFKYGKE